MGFPPPTPNTLDFDFAPLEPPDTGQARAFGKSHALRERGVRYPSLRLQRAQDSPVDPV